MQLQREVEVRGQPAAFSNRDMGKAVSITGNVVFVDGNVRKVNWGAAKHHDLTGTIKSVDPKYKGRVGLEDGQEFDNPAAPAPAGVFPPLTYRPELDGLRAFAVIPVVLFHFKVSGFEGGFTGVDVFFVISGFLITGILLSDLSTNKFSMKRFWIRRCRRLFPALALMLIIVLIAGWHTFLGSTYEKLTNQAWATLLFGANFHFASGDGYFRSELEEPLLHCWSLAVEEQFYFVFPLLLWALWRLTNASKAGSLEVRLEHTRARSLACTRMCTHSRTNA